MSDVEDQGVGAAPAPWSYRILQAADRKSMKLELHTVVGMIELFMPCDFAGQFGRDLLSNASGIVMPDANSRFTPPRL